MVEHADMSKDAQSGKGVHPIQRWSDVPDAAGLATLGATQAAGDRGGVVYQTDTTEYWIADGVGGWRPLLLTVEVERFLLTGSLLSFSANHEALQNNYIGAVLETIDISVTEAAGVVSLNLQKDGGGDLTFVFTDGFFLFDTSPPVSVVLTAGSDTAPTRNFVYVLQSTKTLTVSTSGWPTAEHAPIADVLVQSASGVAADGAYKVHAWTDHAFAAGDNGHLSHVNKWIRQQHAGWLSGVAQTLTITPGSPDSVIFTTTAGVVQQLHEHIFPAFSGTPTLFVVNDSVTPFDPTVDLNTLLTDALGGSMSGRFFSLVIWGCVSEDGTDSKLFVNLPDGSYGTQNGVEQDADRFANFTIPASFKGTGFLISELKLRHQAAGGGTWTSIDEIDLRGLMPAITAGAGASGAQTEFADNLFRILAVADPTKQIEFDASAISTATTRKITMPNKDVVLGENGKLPQGYVADCQTNRTNVTTVAVATGKARDDTDTHDIDVTAARSAVITSTGAGGRNVDTAEQADKWYYIFIIDDSTDVNTEAAFLVNEDDIGSFTMPSGYDVKRRVGMVRNDASSDLRSFAMVGTGKNREVIYADVDRDDLNVFTDQEPTTYTAADCSEFVPPTSTVCDLDVVSQMGLNDYVEFRRTGSSLGDGQGHRVHSAGTTPYTTIVSNFALSAAQSLDYRRNDTTGLGVSLFVPSYREDL